MAQNQDRRLGYIAFKKSGTFDSKVVVKPMRDEVRAEFDAMANVIIALRPIAFAAQMALLNIETVRQFQLDIAKPQPLENLSGDLGLRAMLEFHINASRHVSNCLSTFRSFLDHCDAYLCAKFGKTSAERAHFKTETSRLYDGGVGYRFLYKLRNFTQHFALPISSMNLSHALVHAEAHYLVTASLVLDRDELLSWDGWGPINKEIAALPEKIEILPLLLDLSRSIHELCKSVFRSQAHELLNCNAYISRVCELLEVPDNAVPVVWVGEPAGENMPPSRFEMFPIEEMRLVLRSMGAPA